jgi:hypothetical protein
MNRYPLRLLVVALVTVASVAVLATPPVAAYPAPAGRLAPVTIPGVYRPVQQTLSQPEAQPTQTPRGVTIYWLGERFGGTRDLPPLVLTGFYAPGPPGPGELDYTRADDPSSGRTGFAVTLQVGPRGAWNPPQVPRGPCWARHEITLPHGRASIFMGFASMGDPWWVARCPTRPYDRFIALAYLGQTMVFVDAGYGIVPGTHSWWPILYDTREGMEVIVRALRPRVPAKGETAMPVAVHLEPPLSPAWLIAFLIVGALAGALAALLMHEGGYGLASDMLVGIIGALLGGLLQPRGFISGPPRHLRPRAADRVHRGLCPDRTQDRPGARLRGHAPSARRADPGRRPITCTHCAILVAPAPLPRQLHAWLGPCRALGRAGGR